MAFRVEVEPQAFEDLDAIAAYIKERGSFEVGERWFRGIMRAIRSLQEMPTRCPVAPESRELNQEVRLLLHGRKSRAYKIYFAIRYDAPVRGIIRVLHVRHWARQAVSACELQKIMDESTHELSEDSSL